MATNIADPHNQAKEVSPSSINARAEIKQGFEKIREEIDNKEKELLAEIDSYFNNKPSCNQFNLVWHQTNLSLAIESICEVVERATNSLDKTQKLWESAPHGSQRNNLCSPTSFSICSETKKIYVADTGNSRISCFDENGRNIRVRDLTKNISSWTPTPELVICNPFYKLIWIYATQRPQLFRFVAINTCDFSEKYNINGVPEVRVLAINPDTYQLEYFCYNVDDHCIVYGNVDPIIKDIPLPKANTIYLESHLLNESRMEIQMSVVDRFIFVLYRDTDYRILKFDFAGKLCQRFLHIQEFGIIECFFLISQDYFLLAKIGTTPINQVTKQSIFSPEKKAQDSLQMCIVSSDGQVRGQLSYPITPYSGDIGYSPIKCSQVIQYNDKIIVLLRTCTANLIAF